MYKRPNEVIRTCKSKKRNGARWKRGKTRHTSNLEPKRSTSGRPISQAALGVKNASSNLRLTRVPRVLRRYSFLAQQMRANACISNLV